MSKQQIKISVLRKDEGDNTMQFLIAVSNGISSTSIDFYAYADEFKGFASGLLEFPKTINDTVKYELGEIGERWAYYILLEVFCYENNGNSAIHVIVDNNRKKHHTNKSEFCIITVPASLNRLGELLYDWDPNTDNEILWIAE